MGKDALLSCLDKRELLNQSPISVAKLVEWGEQYEEAGLVHDALDFYERAGASDAMEKLLRTAMDDGDTFLFGKILKTLGREAKDEEWAALARRAEELGKVSFAELAAARGQKEASLKAEQQGSSGETA